MKLAGEHPASSSRRVDKVSLAVACVAVVISAFQWWTAREGRIRQEIRFVEVGARVAELEQRLEGLERRRTYSAPPMKGDFPPWYGREPKAKPADPAHPNDPAR